MPTLRSRAQPGDGARSAFAQRNAVALDLQSMLGRDRAGCIGTVGWHALSMDAKGVHGARKSTHALRIHAQSVPLEMGFIRAAIPLHTGVVVPCADLLQLSIQFANQLGAL